MTMSDRKRRALERAAGDLERLGSEEVIWKRRLADAVLELVGEGVPLTAEVLVERLRSMSEKPLMIEGADFSIEIARKASEVAIAHLEKSLAAHRKE